MAVLPPHPTHLGGKRSSSKPELRLEPLGSAGKGVNKRRCRGFSVFWGLHVGLVGVCRYCAYLKSKGTLPSPLRVVQLRLLLFQQSAPGVCVVDQQFVPLVLNLRTKQLADRGAQVGPGDVPPPPGTWLHPIDAAPPPVPWLHLQYHGPPPVACPPPRDVAPPPVTLLHP
ncbi:hypothetical protein CB1_000350053 [Camelus ferus]|nr:hypothetical protein CB1_000350053 [Camelus ferus]